MIRRAWPEILEELSSIRKVTWMNVSTNASPAGFDGAVLALGFKNQGSATNFERGDHAENLRRAIHKVLGVDCQIRTVDGSSAAAGESGPKAPTSRPEPARAPERQQAAAPAAPPASEPAAPERAVPEQAVPERPVPERAEPSPEPRPAAAEAPVPVPAVWGPAVSNTPQPAPAAWGPADPEKPVFAHLAAQAPSPAAHVWGPAPETAGPASSASASVATLPPAAAPAATAVKPRPAQAAPAAPEAAPPSPAQAPQPAGPQPASPYEDIPYSDEEPADEWESPPDPGHGRGVSRYQQLLSQAKAAEARQADAAPAVGGPAGRGLNLSYVEDIPSDDDEAIEDSNLVGRAAIERILGGRLIEERSLDAT
jgi:DNA polymerase-3 subunit gamma/tau